MTSAQGFDSDASRSYALARQRKLKRLLESHGVLTVGHLRELSGAEAWQVPFELVIKNAVAAGRVRRLNDELYEAGPER
jgi:hypothetical protein